MKECILLYDLSFCIALKFHVNFPSSIIIIDLFFQIFWHFGIKLFFDTDQCNIIYWKGHVCFGLERKKILICLPLIIFMFISVLVPMKLLTKNIQVSHFILFFLWILFQIRRDFETLHILISQVVINIWTMYSVGIWWDIEFENIKVLMGCNNSLDKLPFYSSQSIL